MARYVRVENLTRGTILATRCRVASSLRARSVGLLGTSGLGRGEGLLIERSPSIHMFFMRYPIDALFVNAAGEVVRAVPGLRPWRIVLWARGARDCVELPPGTIASSGTGVGDRIGVSSVADP